MRRGMSKHKLMTNSDKAGRVVVLFAMVMIGWLYNQLTESEERRPRPLTGQQQIEQAAEGMDAFCDANPRNC